MLDIATNESHRVGINGIYSVLSSFITSLFALNHSWMSMTHMRILSRHTYLDIHLMLLLTYGLNIIIMNMEIVLMSVLFLVLSARVIILCVTNSHP